MKFTRKHKFQPRPDKYCALGRVMDKRLSELNYSAYQFGKEFGLSSSYISHIMRGDFPHSPQIPNLMKALGITQEMVEAEKHNNVQPTTPVSERREGAQAEIA